MKYTIGDIFWVIGTAAAIYLFFLDKNLGFIGLLFGHICTMIEVGILQDK